MEHLLCIAIPTYNRSGILDQQLDWLSRNMAGHEALCEIVLSDNASSDETPCVCETWRERFQERGISVRVVRNPSNIGPLPNIRQCIELSKSRFTWVVGDDDVISEGTLSWVIQTLQDDPDLASILMNFSCSGSSTLPRCYDFGGDLHAQGQLIMSDCLHQNAWGLAFLTAHVYRTAFAQAAYSLWPEGDRNYDFQMFVTVYVGLQGRVHAAQPVLMDYVTGENVYRKDPKVGMRLLADTLEVFVRLRRVGFPREFVRHLAFQHLWRNKTPLAKQVLRVHPRYSGAALMRMTYYVGQITLVATL